MNQNYDKQFENIKRNAKTGAKLLLHVCCAPCATYCLGRILDKFDVTLYYSNDNITNLDEWEKRLGEVRKLVQIVNDGNFEVPAKYPLKLVAQPFDNKRFFAVAKGLEKEKEGGIRCTECFLLRLADAYLQATCDSFDYFGTTLTVSPYKNSQLLNQIGLEMQKGLEYAMQKFSLRFEGFTASSQQPATKENPVQWLPSDFKKNNGYHESVRLSQKYQLYRQHYCGCCFGLQNLD